MASLGRAAGVKPEAFKIIDGKLYLSWSKDSSFFRKSEKSIEKADRKWAKALIKLDSKN
jgi:hypothetical protein